ncbi:hypothetical protein SAMN05421880_11768 [Nitrosomonas nitrosa]|uniref:Uncharacterized protein n=1 Tax=Nitrosomonas nitrosa TaxID=52442 RepID=A0A1I4R4Y6_9PROT|nr:hypothetical protein SAMN05421880_11768 [Nitrosomonas nitrosa]
MNNRSACQLCGEDFYPDQTWKTLCIPCYKLSKQRQEDVVSELTRLRTENEELRHRIAIPQDMLKTLILLAHPDRHGNSAASNKATAWLLSQRGRQ